jgi:hypothetical protein
MAIKLANKESATAVIKDGWIVIGVPVANLSAALEGSWACGEFGVRYRVIDAKAFAKEVVSELNRESETGTTMIHKMFDSAMYEAIDQGGEGVEEHPNQEGDE